MRSSCVCFRGSRRARGGSATGPASLAPAYRLVFNLRKVIRRR
jgi:hypothetical protein